MDQVRSRPDVDQQDVLYRPPISYNEIIGWINIYFEIKSTLIQSRPTRNAK